MDFVSLESLDENFEAVKILGVKVWLVLICLMFPLCCAIEYFSNRIGLSHFVFGFSFVGLGFWGGSTELAYRLVKMTQKNTS